jgi:hypothetical protein
MPEMLFIAILVQGNHVLEAKETQHREKEKYDLK